MPSEPQHILLACSRLDVPGGIERAVVNNANLFAERGHAVTVLVLDVFGGSFYLVDPRVKFVQEPLLFGITEAGNTVSRKLAFYKDIRKLKKVLRENRPDVIIGTEYSITVPLYLAGRTLDVKIFAWEHHHFYWLKKNWFWNKLFHFCYPRLQAVVCNNSKEKELFAAIGCRAVVIPYTVAQTDTRLAELNQKTILTAGWLIKRKGVDLIPAVAKKLAGKFPDWHWKIIGKGEELEQLEGAIATHHLENFIRIVPPESPALTDEYRAASVYAMTSRFECLPMVLLEATTQGVPVVAFDCPTGPADIITHGENGFLATTEDVDRMAFYLEQLMANPALRKQMGSAAAESSRRYSAERVYALWKKLFEEPAAS